MFQTVMRSREGENLQYSDSPKDASNDDGINDIGLAFGNVSMDEEDDHFTDILDNGSEYKEKQIGLEEHRQCRAEIRESDTQTVENNEKQCNQHGKWMEDVEEIRVEAMEDELEAETSMDSLESGYVVSPNPSSHFT